jgi:hypothetical protein
MVSNYELSCALERLSKDVKALAVKIEGMPDLLSQQLIEKIKSLTFRAGANLPSLLMLSVAEQKTLEVLKGIKDFVTADDIATVTHRARAVESTYLNGFHRRGMVLKERRNRRVFFSLKEEYCEGQAVDS